MSEIAVKVEDLWKRYAIGHKKSSSFRESIGQWFSKSEADYFWALKELNFEIKRGEAVGIIGKNGAGKSTLLKVLSKITYPTKGRIEINGRVSSLLEVGTGFHPELSGRQNVYLNGTILGMTRREITAKFDEIVAFSGVEKFIDTPVKHYSSGMKVRLAFSVAAHLEPEILIIDEVLAVGDAEFQKKCLGKMEDVTGEGRTVIFVSHNMGAVRNLCSKGILLKNGSTQAIGMVDDILDTYLGGEENKSHKLSHKFEFTKSPIVTFKQLTIVPKGDVVITGEPLLFSIDYEIIDKSISLQNCHISLEIRDRNEQKVIHISTNLDTFDMSDQRLKLENTLSLTIEEFALKPGIYSLGINIVQTNEFLDNHVDFMTFTVHESLETRYASNTHSGIWIPRSDWAWVD